VTPHQDILAIGVDGSCDGWHCASDYSENPRSPVSYVTEPLGLRFYIVYAVPCSELSVATTLLDRVQFETLLSDISAQLIAVRPERLQETIESALNEVRRFFQADRCGLISVSDTLDAANVTFASYGDGIAHVSSETNLARLCPWVVQRTVLDRQVVFLPRVVSDLPPEATVDRSTFQSMGTKTLLVMPIEVAQKRLHLVLISTLREARDWPGEFVPRLRLLGEMLVNTVERARALEDVRRLSERLERENLYLRREVQVRLGPEGIIGRGVAIRRTLALAEQVAPTDSTVLLLGETGSGKERFASYIHECSRRRDHAMVRVNCSAIPSTLIESELFGREKGAYTGALSKQIGRFELAHGSTLFLDEIGELPVEIQVKLLRVLEGHTIERLGNPKPIPVDVRIIAATHRNLTSAVREGHFREDLYYRLNVFPINVPPLRERPEDIPLLIQAFVDQLSGTMGKRIEELDPETMEELVAYPWPGNVRELRNLVERAMIMANGPTLRIHPPETDRDKADTGTDLTEVEQSHILHVLHDTGWRIRGAYGAAARLGLKPTTLESRIKKLGLSRPGSQASS
jgi:formate hydrogenlyase transcriptional activator